MSYYTPSSYTSTWHRARDPRTFVVITSQGWGAGIRGSWMGRSQLPPRLGMAWPGLRRAQVSTALWPLQHLPSLLALPAP